VFLDGNKYHYIDKHNGMATIKNISTSTNYHSYKNDQLFFTSVRNVLLLPDTVIRTQAKLLHVALSFGVVAFD
jgi:hypothetical protein